MAEHFGLAGVVVQVRQGLFAWSVFPEAALGAMAESAVEQAANPMDVLRGPNSSLGGAVLHVPVGSDRGVATYHLVRERRAVLLMQAHTDMDGNRVVPLSNTIKHHIFNVFRGNSRASQKYRDFFARHGIKVDDYTVEMSEAFHKEWIHKAGRNLTTRWKRWIDANPSATTKEVFQQAGRMMDEAAISDLPIVPYK